MFRDLLVHVDGSQAGRRTVQFAADLAVRTGARLRGIHVTPPAQVPPLYKPSQLAGASAQLSSKLALDAHEAAMVFSEEAAGRVANVCWSEAKGDVAQCISHEARYADIVILGQHERQGSPITNPLPIAHSVVLRCGRPVLVVPAVAQPSSLARIAVAWDGSREAVRAVHDALPLLRMARSIQIVTMIPSSAEDIEVDAKSLLVHLAKHGIEIGTDVLQMRIIDEIDLLRKQIEQGYYDLLVMGGYSQPIWLELIFGGVTQSILYVIEDTGACFPLAKGTHAVPSG
jgi:nucleotide-binding universal stress UspA family protein